MASLCFVCDLYLLDSMWVFMINIPVFSWCNFHKSIKDRADLWVFHFLFSSVQAWRLQRLNLNLSGLFFLFWVSAWMLCFGKNLVFSFFLFFFFFFASVLLLLDRWVFAYFSSGGLWLTNSYFRWVYLHKHFFIV